jgi:hypothetical protein
VPPRRGRTARTSSTWSRYARPWSRLRAVPADAPRRAQFGDSYTDSTNYIVTNGTTWGEYLAGYAGLQLHNFAISGATCDNKSTPRTYPDIQVNELNAYYNLTNHTTLPADETLYTIWIGTNDVGVGQLSVVLRRAPRSRADAAAASPARRRPA